MVGCAHGEARIASRGATHAPPQRDAEAGELARARAGVSADRQPLIRSLRELLRAKEAWEFPATVSSLLAVPDEDRAQLAEFVESLIGTPLAETTAPLHVVAAMADDDLQRRRIHRELAGRTHPVPELLRRFAEVRVNRAVLMSDAVGDAENVMLDLAEPAAGPATFVVYVDHLLGTLVKDAFLVCARGPRDRPPSSVLRSRQRDADRAQLVHDLVVARDLIAGSA